jgi:serine/threonine protein kinase
MTFPALAEGARFAGHRVVRLLVEMPSGALYAAENLATSARCALRMLPAELAADPTRCARFEREARVSETITSSHLPKILASGVDEETGLPWLSLALGDGEDLATRIHGRGPLDLDTARRVLRQLGRALRAAHAAGVVHRGLAPEVIFLTGAPGEEEVTLLDLGVGKLLDDRGAMEAGTAVLVRWMAPEQADAAAQIGTSTDVWALGLLAFFMLTGRSYWKSAGTEGTLVEVFREVLIDPLTPPSERARELGVEALVPRGFDEWFLSCVDRAPAARSSNVQQAAEAFPGPVEGELIIANPKGSLYDTGLVGPLYPEPPELMGNPKGSYYDDGLTPDRREIVGNPKGSYYDDGLASARRRRWIVVVAAIVVVALAFAAGWFLRR